jgi:hypothetical protein
MGDTKEENQRYVRKWVAEHRKSIITLRADVIHLKENMPYDVFGNMDGKYLFINGVCGGAASDSGYISANTNTDLSIISNSSIGKGQVTNAQLGLFLRQTAPKSYADIIDSGREEIISKGGDQFSINTPTAGQGLLSYVNMKTGQ